MADQLHARRAPWSIEGVAVRLGRYRWLELRLFEVLGGWVPAVPEPDVKRCLDSHAAHHAWHAELWLDRMPLPGGRDPEELTAPASGMEPVVAALAAPAAPEQTIEKLAGVYRVLLPRTIAAYTAHLAVVSPVADAPTTRALRQVLADELDDWREGEVLLQSLLTSASAVERAAAHQAGLETLLVATGGVAD